MVVVEWVFLTRLGRRWRMSSLSVERLWEVRGAGRIVRLEEMVKRR